MAMKIGNQYRFSYLQARNWDQLAQQAGLSPAQTRRRVVQLAQLIPAAAQRVTPQYAHYPIVQKIIALIEQRCRRLASV